MAATLLDNEMNWGRLLPAIGSARKSATGYEISQEEFLEEEEFVFGKHKTAQVSIHSIERQTGLSFGHLAGLDPLKTATEALAGPVRPLQTLDEIRFT